MNWITPEWLQGKFDHYRQLDAAYEVDFSFADLLSAEINKVIKNILESAEKRDCKTCKYEHEDIYFSECDDCYEKREKTYPNWTPKVNS